MAVKLTDRAVVDFLAGLRSPAPTPGGGSASALAGALGASLLAMVASMPKHRAASEAEAVSLQAAGARCSAISERLGALVDEDSEAYDRVMAAYRLPKGSEAEHAERRGRIQHALAAAIDAPLSVMRCSAEAAAAASVVAAFGNARAASDVGVGLELLSAALRGARLNVEVNLGSTTDEAYAADVRRQAGLLARECEAALAAARARLPSSA